MLDSKSLLSSKGPLGAIWVAAYFFKNLKTSQVLDTDISSCVDKIMQDELHVITYRVLGYLLLGVVRIFSKKTDCLFDDCNEMLIRINDFVIKTKKKMHSKTLPAPYFSITLPETFELDAFDLEILEDASSGNVVPNEDITLKDFGTSNMEKALCSSSTYHYSGTHAGCSTSLPCYAMVEDSVLSHQMDIDTELLPSNNLRNFEGSMVKLQDNRFAQEECMDLDMFCVVEARPLCSIQPCSKNHQANGDPEIAHPEIIMLGEGSIEKLRDSSLDQDKGVNLLISCVIESEPPGQIKRGSDDQQSDEEHVFVSELTTKQVNKTFQVVEEDHDVSNLETDIEKLLNCSHSEVKFMDLDMSCGPSEPIELAKSIDEEHLDEKEQNSTYMCEKRTGQMTKDYPVSITLDKTLLSKEQDISDATEPQFIGVPTPAAREPCRISRKRKCLIDDMTVLENEVMRQSIKDSSDLVSKRRKVPHTARTAWKACWNRNLSHGFYEPLLPALQQELRSLFFNKRLMVMESDLTLQPLKKLEIPVSPSHGKVLKVAIAPQTPVQSSTLMKSFESPWSPEAPDHDQFRPEPFESVQKMVRLEPFESVQKMVRFEPFESAQTQVEPEPFESVETEVRHEPYESTEKVVRLESSESAEEVNRPEPFESVQVEPPLFRDKELELNLTSETNEDIIGYTHQLHEWSARTRVVTTYLHRSFLKQNKKGKDEMVSVLQVLEGNTKKGSARFFYEILVLKTKGYVDVKQDDAYGDILILKLPKWDEICAADQ